ncbi:VIT1/CCC1 transporter family protein [Thermoproteota archaeon]
MVFGFNDVSISILALIAGGSFIHNHIIAIALSGVIAGAISMGIGAYISSKSKIEHHRSEIKRELSEIENVPDVEKQEIRLIYQKKANFTDKELDIIVNRITSDKKVWLYVMMKEELGLVEDRFETPLKLRFIMLSTFLVGGVIPIILLFIIQLPFIALIIFAILTYASLFIIGLWKTTFTDRNWIISSLEMVGVGIIAALITYLVGEFLLSWILTVPF